MMESTPHTTQGTTSSMARKMQRTTSMHAPESSNTMSRGITPMETKHSLTSLPIEISENIAFYYTCPRILGPPVPLTPLLLVCKDLYCKLANAPHLFARVFKYKFSFSAIRRRGFEPRAGEWAYQLRRWSEILRSVRRRRQRRDGAYGEDDAEEPGVQEIMYSLWIMCLEDDGCNRLQMQLAGVYEWVEGYMRTEMYRGTDKGWPVADAASSCAMWVFWYLTTKARLLEESEEHQESLINLVLPFVTVAFRYPTAFAPAHHFNLPLPSSPSSSTLSEISFSIPTPHGPYPIYLQPSRYTWILPHFERWTPLCTPLAADAAKLVYFSRRETILFTAPPWMNLPQTREEHRARVRADLELAAQTQGQGPVDEREVNRVFRSQLPRATVEDYDELNAGLLGGEMLDTAGLSSTSTGISSSHVKGGGTALPFTVDIWDSVRNTFPRVLDDLTGPVSSESILESVERLLGEYVDESSCVSCRWDSDWWRLRLCQSVWEEGVEQMAVEVERASDESSNEVDLPVVRIDVDRRGAEAEAESVHGTIDQVSLDSASDDSLSALSAHSSGQRDGSRQGGDDEVMQNTEGERSDTMFCGYPQKGAVFTPGTLSGLWTGRMLIPSEPQLRGLLLPPVPPAPLFPVEPVELVPAPDNLDPHPNPLPNPENEGEGDLPPHLPDPQIQIPAAALPEAPAGATDTEQEAGHRPPIFNEVTLGVATVPLYVRIAEHVVYAGSDSESSASASNSGGEFDVVPCANIDSAGTENGWLPLNTSISASQSSSLSSGAGITISVPEGGELNRDVRRYEYVTLHADMGSGADADANGGLKVNSEGDKRKRQPGTYHDRETCPGCLAREEALRSVRVRADAARRQELDVERAEEQNDDKAVGDVEGSEGDTGAYDDPTAMDLPSYVLSSHTVPQCTGVRDVLLTGSTDARHGNAWGKWVWRGRVRKWDGLVGLIRTEDSAIEGTSQARSTTFFYGTLVGGRNLVGTWRVASEDPQLPSYEGAFTLGKKEE